MLALRGNTMPNHTRLLNNLKNYISKRGEIIRIQDQPARMVFYSGKENIYLFKAPGVWVMEAEDVLYNRISMLIRPSLFRNIELTARRMLNAHNTIIQIERIERSAEKKAEMPPVLLSKGRQLLQKVGGGLRWLCNHAVGESVKAVKKPAVAAGSIVGTLVAGTTGGIVGGFIGGTLASAASKYVSQKSSELLLDSKAPKTAPSQVRPIITIEEQINQAISAGKTYNDQLSSKYGKARQIQNGSCWNSFATFFARTKSHAAAAFESNTDLLTPINRL
jgi:hypothetical protein